MSDARVLAPVVSEGPERERPTGQLAEQQRASDRGPILVVEDDAQLGGSLVEQLVADGHLAELARTAGHASWVAGMRPPRLVVLGQLDTPRGALSFLEKIRGRDTDHPWCEGTSSWLADIPVIVVSASTEEPDLLRAFDAGADDFIVHPARYLELHARLCALLRRSESPLPGGSFQVGPLRIETGSYAATLHGERLRLCRLEYELLLHLARSPRRVFRKLELLSAVWGDRAPSTTRTLDSHASRLRRKLAVGGEQWVINVRGIGYRLI